MRRKSGSFPVALMGRVVGLKRSLVQLLVLGVALQVCALAAPFYMQWMVDEALVAADLDLITMLGIGFLLLVLMQTAIGAVRSWITTVMATNLNLQWLGNAVLAPDETAAAVFREAPHWRHRLALQFIQPSSAA